jgi:DNA-binding MarR family transcriptional regulator
VEREKLIQAIIDKRREMSTKTIMFHQAVADTLGLNVTDHKCLDLIRQYGAMPAGKLAELTGLTTAAVTGILDRLEQAGFVRRANDPKDRRRTIVELTGNKKLEKKVEAIFIPFHQRMRKRLASYSDSELAFLLDALTKSLDDLQEELMTLREMRS